MQMEKGLAHSGSKPQDAGRSMTNWPGRHRLRFGMARSRSHKGLSGPEIEPTRVKETTVVSMQAGCNSALRVGFSKRIGSGMIKAGLDSLPEIAKNV